MTTARRAACLALLNSLPFDWQARRFVETNLNFFILEGLAFPTLDDATFDAIADSRRPPVLPRRALRRLRRGDRRRGRPARRRASATSCVPRSTRASRAPGAWTRDDLEDDLRRLHPRRRPAEPTASASATASPSSRRSPWTPPARPRQPRATIDATPTRSRTSSPTSTTRAPLSHRHRLRQSRRAAPPRASVADGRPTRAAARCAARRRGSAPSRRSALVRAAAASVLARGARPRAVPALAGQRSASGRRASGSTGPRSRCGATSSSSCTARPTCSATSRRPACCARHLGEPHRRRTDRNLELGVVDYNPGASGRRSVVRRALGARRRSTTSCATAVPRLGLRRPAHRLPARAARAARRRAATSPIAPPSPTGSSSRRSSATATSARGASSPATAASSTPTASAPARPRSASRSSRSALEQDGVYALVVCPGAADEELGRSGSTRRSCRPRSSRFNELAAATSSSCPRRANRRRILHNDKDAYRLVVVDEAHALRNEDTTWYRGDGAAARRRAQERRCSSRPRRSTTGSGTSTTS